MTDWVKTTLGEVGTFERGRRFTKAQYVDSGLGCIHYGQLYTHLGPVTREALTFLPTELRGRLRLAAPGDVVVAATSENVADLGKATAWLGVDHVAVHDDCYIFRHDMDPTFASHLFASSAFQEQKVQFAAGTKVTRISGANLAKIQVSIPSLPEQRRIVDLMAAVDVQMEELTKESANVVHLLRCALADHFESVTGDVLPIVDLCAHVIGGIWGSPEGENEVDVLALGPRIYSFGATDFLTDGSPMRSFSLKQVEARQVQPNDIVLERSGGSPEQPVGRVVIAGEGLPPCVPTDFQRLMRPDVQKVEPRYLFWRLQHDWNNGLTRAFSRRTTGITNLSVKEYIAREVPIPRRQEQRAFVSVADAIDTGIRATKAELNRLRTFRSALLTALLSQEVEIPESYDSLLETVT